ncbi:MAG: hypothetical protein EZS28_055841, partial [Streblomastix strix]
NHSDILSGDYHNDITKFITQKYDLIVDYALQLVLNVITRGQLQNIDIARSYLPIRRLGELTEHSDPIISENAKAIINTLG